VVINEVSETELTNSMKENPPWKANTHSASQETPRLLWNPQVHYGVNNSPPLDPTLSQRHPVHNYPPYFLEIQLCRYSD
jgi:hypothetical protein